MMRQAYLMAASPQPDQFSVLVRGIPNPDGEGEKSYSDKVEKFFVEFHPLHYLSHQMIFHSHELESLLVYIFHSPLIVTASELGHKLFPSCCTRSLSVGA